MVAMMRSSPTGAITDSVARLVYMDRSGRQQVFELDPNSPQTIIGRHPDCDLVSADASVSRRHCMIQHDGEQFRVSDLGAANGTMVNDVRISRGHLGSRDIVRCGSLIMQFFDDDAEMGPPVPPVAAPKYGAGPMPATSVTPAPEDELVHLRSEVQRLQQFNATQGDRLGSLQDELLKAEQRADSAQKRSSAAVQDADALRTRISVLEEGAEKRETLLKAREAEINALAQRLGVPVTQTNPSVHETMDLPSQSGLVLDPPTEVAMPALVLDEGGPPKTSPDIQLTEAVAEELRGLTEENEQLKARVKELEGDVTRFVGELDAARAGHFATDAERSARLTSLERELEAADGRVAAAEALTEEMEAELAQARGRLLELEAMEAELNASREMVASLDQVEADLGDAQARLVAMDDLNDELRTLRDRVEVEEESRAEALERSSRFEEVSAELEAARVEIAELHKQHDGTKAALAEARTQAAGAARARGELKKRQKHLDELAAKMGDLADVDEQRKAMAESLRDAFARLNAANERIEALTAEGGQADEAEDEGLRVRLKAAEQMAIEMEQRAQEAETALTQLRDREQSTLQADSATAMRMEAMQVQLGAVTRRAKMARAQAQHAEATEARVEALQTSVSDARDERDRAEQHALELTVENQALKAELAKLRESDDD